MGKKEPKTASHRTESGGDTAAEPSTGRDMVGIDWSAALDQHRGWLRSVLAARLGERDAVDEVLQEVAVAAISSKSPPSLDRVGPWLYKVAVRRALMYRRSKGRRKRWMQAYVETSVAVGKTSAECDPLNWLLDSERQTLVRKAVGRLHRRDQEILLLKYTQNWSYAEIADHLGLSRSSVESRLHRARRKLRDELAAERITSSTQ